jgi:hypothetical protein
MTEALNSMLQRGNYLIYIEDFSYTIRVHEVASEKFTLKESEK